jgi:hypothetical protein
MAAIPWTADAKAYRRSQAVVFAQWVSTDSNAAASWLKHSDLSAEEKKLWATILR